MTALTAKLSAQSFKVRRDKSNEAIRRRIFVQLCVEQGLPRPVPEHAFAKPDRAWRFDFAWPDARVAIECHGGIWVRGAHSRGAQQLKDFEKLNAAQLRLWKVLHVTPDQLCTAETLAMIRLALQPTPMGATK